MGYTLAVILIQFTLFWILDKAFGRDKAPEVFWVLFLAVLLITFVLTIKS